MDSYSTTFQSWDKVAALYEAKFMHLELYNDSYDKLCDIVATQSPKVLEIGCGPGNITRYLLSKRPDLHIEAIDISPNMIQLAQANNPAAHFRVLDCREIDTIGAVYDVVVCGFCMPYLAVADCAKLINDIAGLLLDRGIFYFSTIEGAHSKSGYETGSSGDKMFVYYYDEGFLYKQLELSGFEVVELLKLPYRRTEEEVSTHLIYIARKK